MSAPSIEDILRTNKPNVSDSSIRTYASLVKNFGKQMGVELDLAHVIKHYRAYLYHIRGMSPDNRKTRLSALIAFIQGDPNSTEAVAAFRRGMTGANEEMAETSDDQKQNEKQKEAMIPLEEVMAKYHALEKEVEPLWEEDKLTKEQFGRYQMYVMLSCILLPESRRSMDWTEFKLRNINEAEDNFLRVVKRKPFLVFNKHKNAAIKGQEIVPCPMKLYKILKQSWFMKNRSEWLLLNKTMSGKINSTQFTALLYDFFQGKISTNILRHIRITDKFGDLPPLKEMKAAAKEQGHSLEMMLAYVKK